MAAGDEINCYCSSCDLELRHVIVAHKSGNSGPIAKVRCNTCNKIHSFRGKPAAKAPGAKKAKAAPKEKAKVVPLEVEWREQLRSRENNPSLKYSPQKEFKGGDVVDHASFGCGIVKTVKEGNKIEVLFQNDIKVLVHKLKAE